MNRRIPALPQLGRLVVAACVLVALGAVPPAATAATVTKTFSYTARCRRGRSRQT
jgi:hypothetical protein